MNVLLIGQSNAARWSSAARGGENTFIDTMSSAGVELTFINAAVGGTPLLPSEPVYWLDFDGALYTGMLEAVNGRPIDAVIWIQGENDARAGATAEEYADGLAAFFEQLRADLGSLPAFILDIGDSALVGDIAAAQETYAALDPLAFLVSCPTALDQVGTLHFDDAAYGVAAHAIGTSMLDYFGIAQGTELMLGSSERDEIRGTRSADRIYARGSADHISGAGGDDLVLGERGRDTLFGGDGNDLMSGGGQRDVLRGGAGDDVLIGHAGRDTLVGGAGADTFIVRLSDVIEDFQPGVDRIAIYGGDVPGEWSLENGRRLYYDGNRVARLSAEPNPGDLLVF